MTNKSKHTIAGLEEIADNIEDAALDLSTSLEEDNLVEAKELVKTILYDAVSIYMALEKAAPSQDFEKAMVGAAKKLMNPQRANANAA